MPSKLALFLIVCITITLLARTALAKPRRHKYYPMVDIRHVAWPGAHYPLEMPVHAVDCFSEMDRRYIVPGEAVTYRLRNTNRLRNGVCMVRVPTRTRASVVRMSTNSAKSYVTFIAGSSDLHMPLHTAHIYADQHDQYGPWHIACRRAYLVFRTKSDQSEWVEFRLEPELQIDREDDQREDCEADGHNFAELELH